MRGRRPENDADVCRSFAAGATSIGMNGVTYNDAVVWRGLPDEN